MNTKHRAVLFILAIYLSLDIASAQERQPGTAIVRVGEMEYVIPIECYDPAGPHLGFSTEPSRLTRERTGRSNPVRLTVRPWKDTSELVISLDRYVAWVPTKASTGGVFKMTLDMSPASSVENGFPVLLTYDRWKSGIRPEGLKGVYFEARCGGFDPEAPLTRKIVAGRSPE